MFELVLYDHGLETAVDAMVRSRFYSRSEILQTFHRIAEEIPDTGLDPATVDERVGQLLDSSTTRTAVESQKWPVTTDNDKLTEAFRVLNRKGIRAIENYGYEASDADALYSEIRGERQWRGYCFYHTQDLIRVLLGGDLMIRFSAATDRPTDAQDSLVGEIIFGVLHEHGLRPNWDHNPRKAIGLRLVWQRRFPRAE